MEVAGAVCQFLWLVEELHASRESGIAYKMRRRVPTDPITLFALHHGAGICAVAIVAAQPPAPRLTDPPDSVEVPR